jgi:hypothetical protein
MYNRILAAVDESQIAERVLAAHKLVRMADRPVVVVP